MIFPKEKLLRMGGIRPDAIGKWSRFTGGKEAAAAVPVGAGRSAIR
jgi:hypothetical protein